MDRCGTRGRFDDELHGEGRADEQVRGERGNEVLRRALHRERDLVDPFEWRLERDLPLPVGRHRAGHGDPRVEPGGDAMCRHPVRAEPLTHVVLTERSERSQGADAQLGEHGDELRHAELPDGHRSEERRAVARRHDVHCVVPARSRRLLRRERAVGDADPRLGHPRGGDECQRRLRCGSFAPEVARGPRGAQHDEPRPHDLHGRDARLERGEHRLEPARVGVGMQRQHRQGGAARLGLPQLQPAVHAGGAGRG